MVQPSGLEDKKEHYGAAEKNVHPREPNLRSGHLWEQFC